MMIDGTRLVAPAVILTPGTFLNGMIHMGLRSYPAGRANEPPSTDLAENLGSLGFKMVRLKTGTPDAPGQEHDRLGKISGPGRRREPCPLFLQDEEGPGEQGRLLRRAYQ